MAALRCECGVLIKASNVNVAAAIATCTSCGAVFSIAQTGSGLVAKPDAVIPDAFSLGDTSEPGTASYRTSVRGGERRTWSFRWFRWTYVFMALFLVFWDTIAFGFVINSVFRGGRSGLLALLLPHVWIGALLTYWTLAHLFNRSTIELGPAGLVVKSGPIPWRSTTRDRATISGFDVSRGFGNHTHARFAVRAIDPDRRAKPVLGSLSEEEATYLAGQLNDALARDGEPATRAT